MNQEEAKDAVVAALASSMDEVIAAVQTAFRGNGLPNEVVQIDYVAQVIVLEFTATQPTSDQLDAIGINLRAHWPEMPSMTATLFKMTRQNTKVILDLNSPSGVESLASSGDLNALTKIAGKEYFPVIDYSLAQGQPNRREGMLQVHDRQV